MRFRRLIAILFAALCFFPPSARAQESIHFGSIAGRVTDSSSAALAAAAVRARHLDTNVVSTSATDADGRFRFALLPVGAYEVTIDVAGFTPVTRRVNVTPGSAFSLPITMTVGGVSASVSVNASAAVIDAARTQIATSIGVREAETLPLNGRSYLDLALLAPGAAPTNVGGGTQLFPETSAVPGVGLSIGSQRNMSNNFTVDGLSGNDDAAALSGMAYSLGAIDQFQVVSSGAQAELGRALGGYVNIVTRSGTNSWRGDGYGFFRDDRWNAGNPLLQSAGNGKLPMHQNQFGGSLGGPLTKDKRFVFGSGEVRRLDQTGLVTIPDATVASVNARLAVVGYRGPQLSTGIYTNPLNTVMLLGKVDQQLSARDRLSVRYSYYGVDSDNARGAGGIVAPSASSSVNNADHTIAVGNVRTLSARAILESRAQFAHSTLDAPPTDAIGPTVVISGIASFGTLSSSPTARRNSLIQVVNNLSIQAGAHSLKAGVDVLYNGLTIDFPRSERGAYTFASLANFLTSTYTSTGFTQTFGARSVSQTNPNLGVYLQDEWHAAPAVTLNAGLRYDVQGLETINTDANNVSPRIGAAWMIDGKTVLRASAGRFFDRVPLRAVANGLLSAGNTTDLAQLRQINVTLAPTQTGAPVFPGALPAAVTSSTLVNFTTMDRALQNAHSDQVSIELERQLGSSGTLSVGAEYLRGRQLIMSINQNVPGCAVAGANNGCRPIAAYANNSQYSSVGSSNYKGAHASLSGRMNEWLSYRASYAYSRSMNNLGEAFFSSPIDPADISKDWARSDDDQRHRFTMLAAVNTPMRAATTPLQHAWYGFQVSAFVQAYSSLPFNITTGANTIQGTPARPIVDGAFISRNAGSGTAFSTVNLRLSRDLRIAHDVKISLMAEAFNVFNRRNDLARVTVFGAGAYPTSPAANFGQTTVVGDPRSLQLGVRIRF